MPLFIELLFLRLYVNFSEYIGELMYPWQKFIIPIYNPGSISIIFLSSELSYQKQMPNNLSLKLKMISCKRYPMVSIAWIALRESISRCLTSMVLFLKIVWKYACVYNKFFPPFYGGWGGRNQNHHTFQILMYCISWR